MNEPTLRNACDSNAGFSLIEVLVASLILGVGLVGVMQGFTASLRASKATEYQTQAVFLAESHLEQLTMSPWLTAGERNGQSDVYPALQWREKITDTKLDGLYEIDVVVEVKRTQEPIYRLSTLQFVMPLGVDETEEDRRELRESGRAPSDTTSNGSGGSQ